MSLGSNTNVKYINIKDGKVVHREDGKEYFYDYIEGKLTDITTPKRTFNGEEVKVWYFKLEGENKEEYILSIGYNSGVAKTILNSLASAEDYSRIRIFPYKKGEYTKVITYSNGNKLNWKYEELPPSEYIEINGKKVRDDSKRMILFDNISKEILQRLNRS